ncbi:MAG: tetratricopeptide repeat protein [Desulfobacterales bacterium]|nr:tetratricopeptide repeat protein [Desulfobacterales bacterium]
MKNKFFLIIFIFFSIQGCALYDSSKEFQQGVLLFKEGKYDESYNYALRAYNGSPTTTKYISLLAWTYIKKGNFEEAYKMFQSIYEQNNESIAAIQGFAWLKYLQGDFISSQKWFQKQISWASKHVNHIEWEYYKETDKRYIYSILSDGYYGIGLIAYSEKDFKTSSTNLINSLKYINDFCGHIPIKTSLADAFYYQGKYKEALSYYKDMLGNKSEKFVPIKYAWCLYYEGDYKTAEKILSDQLKEESDYRSILYCMIFVSYAQNKMTESKQYIKDLLNIDPSFVDTEDIIYIIKKTKSLHTSFKDLASSYFQEGKFSKASEKITMYLVSEENDYEAKLIDAWCDLYLSKLNSAKSKFKLLWEKNIDEQALLGYGVTLFYMRKLDEAEAIFKKVQNLNPENIRAKVAIGGIAYLKGNLNKAISIYNANLNQLPQKELYFGWASHALNNLGWAYFYTEQYQSSLDIFLRLLNFHPKPFYYEIFNGLGWSYLYLGKTVESKAAFEESLKLYAGNSSATLGLSQLANLKK